MLKFSLQTMRAFSYLSLKNLITKPSPTVLNFVIFSRKGDIQLGINANTIKNVSSIVHTVMLHDGCFTEVSSKDIIFSCKLHQPESQYMDLRFCKSKLLKRLRSAVVRSEKIVSLVSTSFSKYCQEIQSTSCRATIPVTDIMAHLYKVQNGYTIEQYLTLFKLASKRNGIFYVSDFSCFEDCYISVVKESYFQNRESVCYHLRDKTPALYSFLQKVKQLVNQFRAKRLPVSSFNIHSFPHPFISWSKNDLTFINFIKEYVSFGFRLYKGHTDPKIAELLKRSECYNNQENISYSTCSHFLTEIGVWSPWEIPRLHSSDLPLIKSAQHSSSTDCDRSWCGRDILSNMRFDFHGLPAYAIDNSVTTEVDDAISIEETADNSHWIHIHISNPTSSFDLKSDIAKTAEILGQSLYLPTATRYMLPIKYTKKFWSLDANSTKQRALTFSGKLGHNGELLDYKIRPSIIRRLLRLTPQEVDRALGDQHPTRSWTLLKRVEKVDESVSSKLDPITTSNLKKILQCASQFNMRRQNNGAFSLLQPSFDVNVQLRYFTAQNQNLNPVLWSAFPDIELLVNDTSITKTNLLVSECMILAGVIAARFCKDHDVPGVFRCQQLAFPSTTIRDLFRRGLEHRKLHGTISLETASSFVPYLTSAYLSDEPKTHQSLGLTKGYMQVTSPLRRYGDLFMHYQIQCVLAGRDQDVVDKHFLKNMLPLWAKKEKSQKNFGKYCYRFWALLLISMLPKELLPECHGVVQLNSALSPVIILDEFGVSARLDTNIDANYKQKLGKRCAVTIQEINPVMNQLIVRLAE